MLPAPPRLPQDNLGARVLACVAIVAAVPIAFYGYGSFAHREPIYTGTIGVSYLQSTRDDIGKPSSGGSLKVDMTSPSIAMASADVPRNDPPIARVAKVPENAQAKSSKPETKHRTAESAVKHRVRSATRRIPAEGRNAFAQWQGFGFTPFGGY